MADMEIVDFGFFHVIEPERSNQILFFRNEEDQDWYELRMGLTEWDQQGDFVNAVYGAWAMVNSEGVVTNVEYDPSRLMPGDRRVLGIDANWKDIKEGIVYKDGALSVTVA